MWSPFLAWAYISTQQLTGLCPAAFIFAPNIVYLERLAWDTQKNFIIENLNKYFYQSLCDVLMFFKKSNPFKDD